MSGLHEMIREYGDLLAEESRLSERKEQLRTEISQEMARQNLRSTNTEHGSAMRTWRFKLLPRPEPVLGLLNSEDLLFFAALHAAPGQGDPRPQVWTRNPGAVVRHRKDGVVGDQTAAGKFSMTESVSRTRQTVRLVMQSCRRTERRWARPG